MAPVYAKIDLSDLDDGLRDAKDLLALGVADVVLRLTYTDWAENSKWETFWGYLLGSRYQQSQFDDA